jgi:hydrogenase maturation protease
MRQVLVLCCGNPDCADDAAGPLVARDLRQMGIQAHEHRGDALSLIEAWRSADDVILVDALVTGKRSGTLTILNAGSTPSNTWARLGSSHGLGLAEAMALSRALGCLPRRLILCGIEARRFDLGQPPSKAVERGAERAARRIYEYCIDPGMPAV